MQQDLFVEKIVKRKRRGLEILLSVMIVFATLFIILISFALPILLAVNFFYISALVSFGAGYLAYRLITGLSKEYEYSITNDDFTVDRIVAQRKRSHLFSGSCKDFLSVARITDTALAPYKAKRDLIRLDVRSGDPDADVWFIHTQQNGVQYLILFEPDERFIAQFRRYNPRNVSVFQVTPL